MNENKGKKVVQMGMFCAIAYLLMVVGRISVVMFLKYDPKDVVITVGGFIFGPLSAALISLVVSLVEMFTVSDTGVIGMVMNVLSTCAYVCTAAFIYKKLHTVKGAVIGLVTGGILMTVVMLLWNYLVTPLYMGYPREAVAAMLLPVFLPFNLVTLSGYGADLWRRAAPPAARIPPVCGPADQWGDRGDLSRPHWEESKGKKDCV